MNKNVSRPILVLVAIILGFVIYKHVNFMKLTLKDPWLDALYIITFIVVLYLLVAGKRKAKRS